MINLALDTIFHVMVAVYIDWLKFETRPSSLPNFGIKQRHSLDELTCRRTRFGRLNSIKLCFGEFNLKLTRNNNHSNLITNNSLMLNFGSTTEWWSHNFWDSKMQRSIAYWLIFLSTWWGRVRFLKKKRKPKRWIEDREPSRTPKLSCPGLFFIGRKGKHANCL